VFQFLFVILVISMIVAAAAAWLGLGAYRRRQFRKRVERSVRQFQTGDRSLGDASCDFHDDVSFASDRATGETYALQGVTIAFEAVVGGDMEDVEAVGNLRCGTAIFVHRNGNWTTDGRAVFNLQPTETLERYRECLVPLSVAE
jgi:hypothetical protein